MGLLEFLFGSDTTPIKRIVDVLFTEGRDDFEILSGEHWSLAENGSVDCVRVSQQRFYPSCKCAVDARHPLGGVCSYCHQAVCLIHHTHCRDCSTSVCCLHSKHIADSNMRVCLSCAEWQAPKQIALQIVRLLKGW